MTPDASVIAALAPHGRLRVGVNMSNFLLVSGESADSQLQGVSPDVGRLVADALGVPVEFIPFKGPGPVADAAGQDIWDIANIANEPARAAVIDFSPAYSEIQANYLVPEGSSLKSLVDVDVPGTHIAVKERSAYELWLTDNIKHAEVHRYPGFDEAFDAFVEQGFDALACLRPKLLQHQADLPGSIILDEPFTAVKQSVGCQPGNNAASRWLSELILDAVASGKIAAMIERHGAAGLSLPSTAV